MTSNPVAPAVSEVKDDMLDRYERARRFLYGVDENKVQALSDDKVLDFHKRGLFIPIHAMLGSIGQVNRLAQLRNQSESPAKVNAIRFTPVTATEEK